MQFANGRRLLNGVSLNVHSGEVAVVLGRSGAGKSTLGDVLFDLLPERVPDATVEAESIVAEESGMALILQRGSLFDHMSMRENIRFAAKRRGGKSLTGDELTALLTEVGLDSADREVAGLSGGEERRVTVARGLATEPRFIFFDEPAAGLDVTNVRRIGALIRRVCSDHGAGAIVVTHNPLLTALVADQVLYLDRSDGTIAPLLSDWTGPAGEDDDEALVLKRAQIEAALLSQDDELPTMPRTGAGSVLRSFGRRAGARLLAPGRLLWEVARVLLRIPQSIRHTRDFLQLWWMTLRLMGFSGLPFFALVAAIFSATFLSIAFAAAELVSPQLIVENLRGDFILALTPPLCGFLFAARSGSALAAWLGGMSLRRQTDALRSLGVQVDQYLRVPVLLGAFTAFVFTTCVFGAAMFLAAQATALGFGVVNAGQLLTETSASFGQQLIEKTLLYGAVIGAVATHVGLGPKRTSQEVARGITRTIILCTLAVVLSELFFAMELHGF